MTSRRASIVSHVPGRLRLRHPALGRADVNAEVAAAIAAAAGVVSVTGNPRTAGVLVLYDAAALAPDRVEDLVRAGLAAVEGAEADGPPVEVAHTETPKRSRIEAAEPAERSARSRFATAYRRVRVPVNLAMLATLGGSLLALGIGRKAHAALGVAHLGVLALHLVQYRRRLVS